MRKLGVMVFAAVVFVFNPAFLCGPSYDYGAKEIMTALSGTWTITLERTPATTVAFRIEQQKAAVHSRAPGVVGDAAACGSRTLVASANACIDDTRTPLTLIALDGFTRPLAGNFIVFGTSFERGQ